MKSKPEEMKTWIEKEGVGSGNEFTAVNARMSDGGKRIINKEKNKNRKEKRVKVWRKILIE